MTYIHDKYEYILRIALCIHAVSHDMVTGLDEYQVKALVVDDSAEHRQHLETLLKGQGHAATGATSDEEALEKLKSNGFDLIFADILMLARDGFRLLQECKDNPSLEKIPFVLISGVHLDREDEDLALRLGVKGSLHKPVEQAELIHIIETSTSGQPTPPRRGRKPKISRSVQDIKLLQERLSLWLAQRVKELETEIEGHKQEDAVLRQSEAQHRLLLESMTKGVLCLDADGRILSTNAAALRILGLTGEQIKGRTIPGTGWRAIHEDGTDYMQKECPPLLALTTGGAVRNARMGVYNPVEGRYRWISIDAIPLTHPGEQKPYLACVIFTDITDSLLDHRAIAENESRLHAILESTDEAIFSIDRDFRLIAANSNARRHYEEATGHRLAEGMDFRSPLDPGGRSFWEGMAERVIKGEHPAVSTAHYELPRGRFDVEFSVFPIVSPSGYITGFSFFGRNITRKDKDTEGTSSIHPGSHEQSADEALRANEERFRIAAQCTSDLVWDWDIPSGHLELHGKIDDMLGYKPGEFPRTLEAWEKAIHPEDRDRVMDTLYRQVRTGEPYYAEYRVIRKNGAIRYWIDRGLPLRDEKGESSHYIGACIDVTEQKRSEQRSAIRRDLALELASTSDLDHALHQSLLAAIKIAGCDSGAVYLRDETSGRLHIVTHEGLPEEFITSLNSLDPDSDAYRLIMARDPQFLTSDTSSPELDHLCGTEGVRYIAVIPFRHHGNVIGCLAVFSHTLNSLNEIGKIALITIGADIENVYERILSTQQLEKSDERYRLIADNTEDVIWVIDKELHYTYLSPSVFRQRGYTPEEMLALPFEKTVASSSLEKLGKLIIGELEHVTRAKETQAVPLTTELELCRKDGSTFWAETSMTLLLDEDRQFNGIMGISRDVTQRKEAMEKLRQSEERYRTILDEMQEAYFEIDPKGNFTFFNELLMNYLGYTREEMTGLNYKVYTPPEERKRVLGIFSSVFQTGIPAHNVHMINLTKDGEIRYVENSVFPIRDADGNITGLRGLGRDITEHVKMQKDLLDSEARYRSIVETAGASVVIVDNSATLTYVNDLACKTLGYTQQEMLGRPFADFLHPDDKDMVLRSFTRAVGAKERLNEVTTIEFRALRKDGGTVWFYTTPTRMTVEGLATGFSAIMSDMTRLKQAETALQASEQRYRSLFENSPIAIYMQDPYGRFISVNEATCRITGYSREEILAMSFEKLVVPEDQEESRNYFIKAMRSEPQTYEQHVICKYGRRIILSVTNSAIRVNDRLIGVYGVAEDITARKKAEEELKSALDTVSATLESTIDAMAIIGELRDPYTAGHQRLVAQLAVAIAREIGLPEEQINGLRVAGLLHDVGKVHVPSEILSKPGKLSELEKALVRAHAEAGYEIVRTIKFPWPIADSIRQHHERMDGSGYPQGLKGEEIILEARILAVADVVEAMTAHRPYRPALGLEATLTEITDNKDTLYYGPAVDACITLFTEKGFTFDG